MKMKHLMMAAAIALLPLAADAATLIVPVAGSAPGANGSVWKSDVTLHNTSGRAIVATLTYHDQNGAAETFAQTVPPRGTLALQDIVRSTFKRENTLGAIEINVADSDANRIAITSRTFNELATGEFGQDIPAIRSTDAATAGDVAVIEGPTSSVDFRFNVGLYTLTAANIRWDLVRSDGTVAATQTIAYAAGVQNQSSAAALFNTDLKDNDVVHAAVLSGTAIFYGSIVNQASGDPSFVPGVRTREESRINFLGIDRDQNGTVDVAAKDNVLSAPVDAYTIGFPTFFRIVTAAESGEKVTYEILSSTADARLVDDIGTVQLVASAALKGTTGDLTVRATAADGQSTVLTIPVKFF
ncbi:MAG TPA: hypothetical protein VLV78_16130 [Thermoanaerobaculia bacterium]|nr:hypothetical protein [Thermoanaerobaculia bacterium]